MTTPLKKLLGDAGAGLDKSHGTTTLYQFLDALTTEVEAMRAAFNAHTHKTDAVADHQTSKPASDTESLAATTPLSVAASVSKE